jgi:hypothetical protein
MMIADGPLVQLTMSETKTERIKKAFTKEQAKIDCMLKACKKADGECESAATRVLHRPALFT